MAQHFRDQRGWSSSNLGRALDPAYSTNLAIILLTVVAGGVSAVVTFTKGGTIPDSFVSAGRVGLYLFLCWALTREIDPDHDKSAFASFLIGLTGLAFVDRPSLLVGFWLIGLLRLLNRTPGSPATKLDSSILMLASVWLAWRYDWALGLVAGLAFMSDSMLHRPQARHRIPGGLMVLLSGMLLVTGVGEVPTRVFTQETTMAAIASGLLIIPLFRGSAQINSLGDGSDERLDGKRVKAAQIALLITAIILLSRSLDGVSASMVEFVPLLGASMWHIRSKALEAIRSAGQR